MKIGLIGDIHANLPALEAVITHSEQMGVQFYWNIGDFVGYNAFPEEVVQLIQTQKNVISIIGNYDLKVLSVEKKRKKWSTSKDPDKLLSFEWTFQHLSPSSREFLNSLPRQRELAVGGWKILLVHGSPASIDEHLLPDTPEERFNELAGMTRAQVVICGHSHHAFTRIVNHTWFINTGSIGRPDDGDPRSAYAILNLDPEMLEIEHFRIPYDIERAVEGIYKRRLPEQFADMIRQGRNLAAIKERDKK